MVLPLMKKKKNEKNEKKNCATAEIGCYMTLDFARKTNEKHVRADIYAFCIQPPPRFAKSAFSFGECMRNVKKLDDSSDRPSH